MEMTGRNTYLQGWRIISRFCSLSHSAVVNMDSLWFSSAKVAITASWFRRNREIMSSVEFHLPIQENNYKLHCRAACCNIAYNTHKHPHIHPDRLISQIHAYKHCHTYKVIHLQRHTHKLKHARTHTHTHTNRLIIHKPCPSLHTCIDKSSALQADKLTTRPKGVITFLCLVS